MIATRTGEARPARPRRRFRKILLYLALVAVVFLAIHTALSLITGRRLDRAVDRIEESRGPLRMAALEPERVPRGENRARWARAAAGIADLEAGPDKSLLATHASYHGVEPGEDGSRAVRVVLDRNREALELLAGAAERPRSDWEIDYGEGVAAEVPPLLDIINLSRLNMASAIEALRADRPEEAAAAVEHGLALAASLENEPVLIVQLVRVTVYREAVGTLRAILERDEIDDAALGRIQEALDAASEPDPVRMGLVGEMAAFHELFRDIDRGRVDTDTTSFLGLGTVIAPWLMRPVYREDMRFYVDHLDRLLTASAVPPYRRSAEGHEVDAEPDFAFYNVMAKIMLPNIADVVRRADLHGARLVLGRTAAALRRHRLAEGEYPGTLDALAPAYLDAVPIDPFTGEPPVYRPEGEGFALECLGEAAAARTPKVDAVILWEIPR